MPKTIHTPRDELICGKLDKARELVAKIETLNEGYVDLIHILFEIEQDAQRMENALIRRKYEVESLRVHQSAG